MKRNHIMIILITIMVIMLVGIYVLHHWLVVQINEETEEYKAVKPAHVSSSGPKTRPSQTVNDEALKMDVDPLETTGDKMSQEAKDPVYEPPLENVILVQ